MYPDRCSGPTSCPPSLAQEEQWQGPLALPPPTHTPLRLVEGSWATPRSRLRDKRGECFGRIQMLCKCKLWDDTTMQIWNSSYSGWHIYSFIYSTFPNLKLWHSVQVTNMYFVQSTIANAISVSRKWKKNFFFNQESEALPNLPFYFILH